MEKKECPICQLPMGHAAHCVLNPGFFTVKRGQDAIRELERVINNSEKARLKIRITQLSEQLNRLETERGEVEHELDELTLALKKLS